MPISQFNLEHESHSTNFTISFSLITSQFDIIWVEEDSNRTAGKGNDKFSHSRPGRHWREEEVPTPSFLISPTDEAKWLTPRSNWFKIAVPTEQETGRFEEDKNLLTLPGFVPRIVEPGYATQGIAHDIGWPQMNTKKRWNINYQGS